MPPRFHMIAFSKEPEYLCASSADHMKTKLLPLLLSALCLLSCTKPKEDVISDENSYVTNQKYACGPTCDGLAWMIHTAYGDFEAVNLPDNFREYNLPVKVEFIKTGKVAEPYRGTGEELVNIRSIERR